MPLIKTIAQMPTFHFFALALLIFAASIDSKTLGFSVKLIPIDSPKFSFFPKNLTQQQKHQKLAQISKTRAFNLQSFSKALTDDIVSPPIMRDNTGYYVIEVGIGTPSTQFDFLLDSGSNDTWIQCEGCSVCFPLPENGYFRWRSSSTYRELIPSYPLCYPPYYKREPCSYVVHYISGQYSIGRLANDTFTFLDADGEETSVFNEVVFGCGFKNVGFDNPYNEISGVFGLGFSPRSVIMQLSSVTKQRFSYCLPAYPDPFTGYSYLYFGDDADIEEGDVKTIPILPGESTYYLTLTRISVGDVLLDIDPNLFLLKPDKSGGFSIDSAAPQTILIRGAYEKVRDAMAQQIQQIQGWTPKTGEMTEYDLCYYVTAGEYDLPTITFHFQEETLKVNSGFIFEDLLGEPPMALYCMIILPDERVSIFGALQQVNYRFLYDIGASTLSFAEEECMPELE